MVEWLSQWAGAIIVAVIIGTVIEMILPEGSSKKFIKVVIGIYIVFTIITPIINKFTGEEINVSDILELDDYIEEAKEFAKVQNAMQDDNESSIRSMYISGIKNDIKAKIETRGYIVNSVDLEVANDDTYTIKSIAIDAQKQNENTENTDSGNNEQTKTIEEVNEIEKVEVRIDNQYGNSNTEVKNNTTNNLEQDNNLQDTSNDRLSNKEKKELIEYLSGVYEVKRENISIN